MRAHHVGPVLPYEFGKLIENGCKHYINLRYSLLPYIYSYMYKSHKVGSSIMRPLVFEYQNDENVFNLQDEFLFGKELLIAPVLNEANKLYTPSIYEFKIHLAAMPSVIEVNGIAYINLLKKTI
jgi:alpha-glucosidase (family GH31 glycosyl hydrolase)